MRQIRWTTEAADQLETAVQHIQQDNPAVALNVAQTVIGRIEQADRGEFVEHQDVVNRIDRQFHS